MSLHPRHYPDVEPNPNFAALEEDILKFWQGISAFEKSVENRPTSIGEKSNNYVFYDGPPFANGLPHYGHLLTGYVKDVIARYQTMRGKRVERRFGWDCHGLPAEMAAEKELGISGRAAIQNYGIDKFNEYCRTSVMKYVGEWRTYVTRQGRWVDFDHDYKTMDQSFMESVLWAFSELYKKGLVYESMRVMPYSWAAETPVSNFETRIDNATRPREDKAVTVVFELNAPPKGVPKADKYYLLAWTTTPWTLPSNLALAVNKKIEYVGRIKKGRSGEQVCEILGASAANRYISFELEPYTPPPANALNSELSATPPMFHLRGEDLLGLTYKPLFPYLKDTPNAFKVIDGGEAVTEGDGTSVLHVAPGFGEVDQQLANSNGIETITPVDEKGRFEDTIFDLPDLQLKGLTVVADTRQTVNDITLEESDKAQHIAEKDVLKYGLANMRITRWLKKHGHLVKDEPYTHNYPHCWRTDTPLIYRAMSSWYVQVTTIKDKMANNNQAIHWIPDHVRDGQMGKGIESAPDWSISRNRFWGTPIPIWKSPSGKLIVPGSIAEIEKLSGQKVKDLHRPYIDAIVIKQDGEEYTRVEDVFDCWFESGSMPYAQLHYPFENKKQFEENFPADFITEYIAQTRGWFYTLQVLSAALFDCAPFKHVICHGVVIDEETGLKYSKRLKNYKDPQEVMDQYGADALRWMMLASPVMRGADLAVDPDGKFIRDVVRLTIKPIWNAYNFFTLYANADGLQGKLVITSENILDRYILAKCKAAVEQARESLDAYDTPGATDAITGFFEVLNNWYIRRSRPRFWAEKVDADKQAAYDTLYTVLTIMVKAAAPLLPLVSESIWCGLTGKKDSVHWQDFPDVSKINAEEELIADMDRVRDICTAVLAIRNNKKLKVRQPLSKLTATSKSLIGLDQFKELILDECNVEEVEINQTPEKYVEPDFPVIKAGPVKRKLEKDNNTAKLGQIYAEAKKRIFEVGGDILKIAGEELDRKKDEWRWEWKSTPQNTLPFEAVMQKEGEVIIVLLDDRITPELEAKGRARDLVRMVQQARKDAGLDVSDRISLALQVPPAFSSAVKAHADYIKEQTLAVSLAEGKAKSEKEITQELDGEKFIIGISKAA